MYQKPKDFPSDQWDRSLYAQHNYCTYQKGYLNEDGKARMDERLNEIRGLLRIGVIYCPAWYRKKYKIFEFKNAGKGFVQLELF